MGAQGSKDPNKLDAEQINLLLACTSFNEAEIRSWHDGFMAREGRIFSILII
jgi:hypothetical protein